MPRIVKAADVRQDEILDVAQRLFMSRGYADTPVQAILDEIGIAKGTFYHHYPSKSDLLDALVQRMVGQSLAALRPIVDDPQLDALTKLNRLYQTAQTWKAERRTLLLGVAKALASDANVLLRERIERDSAAAFLPMLTAVIAQGRAEGVFDTARPAHAARIVHEVSSGLFVSLRRALLAGEEVHLSVAEVQDELAAFHDAVERVLGAPRGSVHHVDSSAITGWLASADARRSA